MPIYEFDCGGCGKSSEVLVRSTKWQGTKCPQCGSTKLQKRLSVFAAASSSATSAAPACETGACPMLSPRQSAGCGCCGPRHHH